MRYVCQNQNSHFFEKSRSYKGNSYQEQPQKFYSSMRIRICQQLFLYLQNRPNSMPGQVNPCPFRFGQFLGLAFFTYGAIMDSINDVCFRCQIVGDSCFWECDFVTISLISIGVYFGAHMITLIAVLCFVKEEERTFYWIDEVIASMEMTDNALLLLGYGILITILFMYPMIPAGLLCLAGIFMGITLLSQKIGEWRQRKRAQRNIRQQIVVTILTAG